MIVSPPAVKMPRVSSALARVNSETECSDGVDIFFSPGATTPLGGCILQPCSGL